MRKAYRIRWITPRQINELREYKKAWEDNREGMLKRSKAGNRASVANRKRRLDWLTQLLKTDLGDREMTSKGLVQVLGHFIETRQLKTNVTALRMLLFRKGIIRWDADRALWVMSIP